MRNRGNLVAKLLAAAAFGVLASSALAIPMPVDSASPAVFENDPTGGSVIHTVTNPFATANYTGTLTSTVISGDPSNPYGGLTFTYVLTNAIGGANAIERLTIDEFTGYATDMSYQLATGTQAPSFMGRQASGSPISFTFAPVGAGGVGRLDQGEVSDILVVQTDATLYKTVIANVINGSGSAVNAVGPHGPTTPEPATLTALAAGLGFLARRTRR